MYLHRLFSRRMLGRHFPADADLLEEIDSPEIQSSNKGFAPIEKVPPSNVQ